MRDSPIPRTFGDDPSDAAARVGNVTEAPGDHVEVELRHPLEQLRRPGQAQFNSDTATREFYHSPCSQKEPIPGLPGARASALRSRPCCSLRAGSRRRIGLCGSFPGVILGQFGTDCRGDDAGPFARVVQKPQQNRIFPHVLPYTVRICKPLVVGSIPTAGSNSDRFPPGTPQPGAGRPIRTPTSSCPSAA
jgi:hypothetical protein